MELYFTAKVKALFNSDLLLKVKVTALELRRYFYYFLHKIATALVYPFCFFSFTTISMDPGAVSFLCFFIFFKGFIYFCIKRGFGVCIIFMFCLQACSLTA